MSIEMDTNRQQELLVGSLLIGKMFENGYLAGGGFTVNTSKVRENIILPTSVDCETGIRTAIGLMEVKGGLPEDQYESAFKLFKLMYEEEFENEQ